MKKFLISALCALLVTSSAGCSLAADKADGYLALGDSITTGFEPGGSHLTDDSFAGIIASKYGKTYDNAAADGSTSAELLKLVQSGEADGKIKNAGLVTITSGGNDMLYVLYSKITDEYNALYKTQKTSDELMAILSGDDVFAKLPVAAVAESVLASLPQDEGAKNAVKEYAQNIRKTAEYIKGINPTATIAVASQYNPFESLSTSQISFYRSLCECVEIYVKLMREELLSASDGAFRVADVYSAFSGKPGLCNANEQSLDVHPTREGHALIAQTFAEVLKPEITIKADGENTAVHIFAPLFSDGARVIGIKYLSDGKLGSLHYYSADADRTVTGEPGTQFYMYGADGTMLAKNS